MEATNLEQLFLNADSVQPEHLVYEANDEALLFYFRVCNNGKCYHTKMTIDWSGLNWIINKCLQAGVDVYDSISQRLFDAQDKIREYRFENLVFNAEDEARIAA